MAHRAGRHYLQLPGPSHSPDRILRAISQPVIDHRGPAFRALARRVLEGLKTIFKTDERVFIYPSSATGAWEAALVNTLSPGDHVLMFDHGVFAERWRAVAERVGLTVEWVPGDWHQPVTASEVGERLAADTEQRLRAVLIVHNETSTGVATDAAAVRRALDEADHPALLLVDAVSSLGAADYQHDAWGVDVTVCGSQKALMLPPGLSFTAVSAKALEAHRTAKIPRSYWDWSAAIRANDKFVFPSTPATNLLYGLDEAIVMMTDEGLPNVFERHARHAEATRRAVHAWGLTNFSVTPSAHAKALTAVEAPDGFDANELRTVILERFDMSLGGGLGRLSGRVFRIGHLGDINDLTLAATLSGIEMGLQVAGWPHRPGGAQVALEYLAQRAAQFSQASESS